MLASTYRLKKSDDFDEVMLKGRNFQTESLRIFVLNTEKDGPQRFGVKISTKISKISVSRNRIRRALFEAARFNFADVPRGYDIVFLPKKEIINKTVEEIMGEIKSFVSRGLFK